MSDQDGIWRWQNTTMQNLHLYYEDGSSFSLYFTFRKEARIEPTGTPERRACVHRGPSGRNSRYGRGSPHCSLLCLPAEADVSLSCGNHALGIRPMSCHDSCRPGPSRNPREGDRHRPALWLRVTEGVLEGLPTRSWDVAERCVAARCQGHASSPLILESTESRCHRSARQRSR